jgi:dTDP-4-dehydrorhamnose reductase
MAECVVINECKSAIVVRTNFFGWGPSYKKSFSDYIIDNLRNNSIITLFSDVYYTPISMQRLVDMTHHLIVENKSGIFNISTDQRISKYDFGLMIANKFSLNKSLISKGMFKDRKDLVKRPCDMSLSNHKIKKIFKINNITINDDLNLLQNSENRFNNIFLNI